MSAKVISSIFLKKLSGGNGETSQELLRKLPADRCVVNSVAAHPSLPLVATAGIDANIKAWDVDVATAENFSRRPVSAGEIFETLGSFWRRVVDQPWNHVLD